MCSSREEVVQTLCFYVAVVKTGTEKQVRILLHKSRVRSLEFRVTHCAVFPKVMKERQYKDGNLIYRSIFKVLYGERERETPLKTQQRDTISMIHDQ